MKFDYQELVNAVKQNIISQDQLNSLVELKKESASNNKVMNYLYYGGALLIISALTWLMKSSWDSFGGGGIFVLSLLYSAAFIAGGIYLWFYKVYKTPGGLLFTVVICLMPLLMFGLLKYLDFWPSSLRYGDFYFWIKGKWVILEITGIAVGLIILYFVRFPFIMAPIAFGLWFLSMDIVPIIFHTNTISWTERKYISIIFGIIILVAGYLFDFFSEKKYSFWLYLFGLLALTSALSIYYNDDHLMFFIFFLVNLFFIMASLILDQKVFLVFGMIGMAEFLGRISYKFFKGSVLFPFVLTFIGIALIVTGILYQKNKKRIHAVVSDMMPGFLKKIKPRRNR